MGILIMYLNYDIWEKQHFQIAAVVINVQEGLSSIMVIVLAHLPHTYKGYFKIIVTTNAAYVVVSISYLESKIPSLRTKLALSNC